MRKLFYFGCIGDKGHYLWIDEQTRCHNRDTMKRLGGVDDVTDSFLRTIDGTYTPLMSGQGAYKVSTVPPFTIVAWNDYSLDTRPGSNSVLLAVGYESPAKMFTDAIQLFPSVMKRQMLPYLAVQAGVEKGMEE